MLLLLVAQSLLPLVQLVLSKAVIDRAAMDFHLSGQHGALAGYLPLAAWITLTAASIEVGQLIQPLSRTLQTMAGDRLTGYFSDLIIRTANGWKGLARFEDPGFADDLERVRSQAGRMGLQLLLYGATSALNIFTMVTLVLTLIKLQPLAPLVVLLATLPEMAMVWQYLNAVGSHLYYKTPDARRLEYARDMTITVEPAKDIRHYNLFPLFDKKYRLLFERTVGDLDRLRRRLVVRVGLAGLLSALTVGGVYVYTVLLIGRGASSETPVL